MFKILIKGKIFFHCCELNTGSQAYEAECSATACHSFTSLCYSPVGKDVACIKQIVMVLL